MKLKDFIKTVLVDIDAGINEAAKKTRKRAWLQVSEGKKGVDFDVAVTVSSEATGDAGAEISVVPLGGLIGAKANAEANIDAKIASEEVSRVKFTIVTEFDSIHAVQDSLPRRP